MSESVEELPETLSQDFSQVLPFKSTESKEFGIGAVTGFFAQVAANPGAEPVFFGGTENIGFHGLELGEDAYYTIVTTTAATDVDQGAHAAYGVFDYPPVERPAE